MIVLHAYKYSVKVLLALFGICVYELLFKYGTPPCIKTVSAGRMLLSKHFYSRIKAVTCSLAVVKLLLNFTWKHPESFMQQYSCLPRSCRSLSPTPTPTLPRLSNSAADCRVATKRWGLSGRPLMFKKKRKKKKSRICFLRKEKFHKTAEPFL